MTKIVKLFLPNEFYEELLYQYEAKDADLRKLVHGFLTPLGKQGKMVKLNQIVTARIMEKGKMSMKDVEIRNIDLEATAVKPSPNWIPEKVTKDEIKIYELTVSDRLYEDLEYFGKIFCARLEIYNNSLDKKSPDYKDKVAIMPTCFEQIIQDNSIAKLSSSISENIDKEYDEDFKELEKKKSPKKEK